MPAARDIKESVVDAAGEHISEEFKEKVCRIRDRSQTAIDKQSMGLAEITMKE
jgi:hypothetical protein